jgi:hypothetical protein
MPTIQSRFDETTDGRKTITLRFERESPEADSPIVETVYEIESSESSPLEEEVAVLVFLSCTRVDTREPVKLTRDERRHVVQAAAAKIVAKR